MNWSRTIVKVSGFKTGCIVKTNHLRTWQDLGRGAGYHFACHYRCVENRLFFSSVAFLRLCQRTLKRLSGWKRSNSQVDLGQTVLSGACEHCYQTSITSGRPWMKQLLLRKVIFTLPTQGEHNKVLHFLKSEV